MKSSKPILSVLAIAVVGLFTVPAKGSLIDIWVVTTQGSNDPIIDYLDRYTNVGTITTGSFTGGAPGGLTSDDLVIVSRYTSSVNYDDDATEIDSWNNLPAKMILLSAYLARGGASSSNSNSRWGWVDNGGVSNLGTSGMETTVSLVDQTDPLFDGVTFTGTSADLYNVDGSGANIAAFVQTPNAEGLGGGEFLANASGRVVAARWDAGDALVTNKGNATVHGGDRLFLAMHAGGSPSDFTPDGQLVLNNAFQEFGLVPEPSSALLLLFSLTAGFLSHRPRRGK